MKIKLVFILLGLSFVFAGLAMIGIRSAYFNALLLAAMISGGSAFALMVWIAP